MRRCVLSKRNYSSPFPNYLGRKFGPGHFIWFTSWQLGGKTWSSFLNWENGSIISVPLYMLLIVKTLTPSRPRSWPVEYNFHLIKTFNVMGSGFCKMGFELWYPLGSRFERQLLVFNDGVRCWLVDWIYNCTVLLFCVFSLWTWVSTTSMLSSRSMDHPLHLYEEV